MPKSTTLADDFLARAKNFAIYNPLTVRQIQDGVRRAHKFVLDEDAARKIARIVMASPDIFARENDFARTPFDTTWIEWPSWHYWMEFVRADPELYESKNTDTADWRIGYLIDHNRVNVIVGGSKNHPDAVPDISLLQYRLHTYWQEEDRNEFCRRAGISQELLDEESVSYEPSKLCHAFMWGSSLVDISIEDHEKLHNAHTAEFIPMAQWRAKPGERDRIMGDGEMAGHVMSCVGELRTIVALLLCLNRKNITSYVDVEPRTRTFISGKLVKPMRHTKVYIPEDPTSVVQRMTSDRASGASGYQLRWREVRGHFRENKTARDYASIAGCLHQYEPVDMAWKSLAPGYTGEVRHWLCSECNGKRWRCDEYEQGSKDIPNTTHPHHYEVKVR